MCARMLVTLINAQWGAHAPPPSLMPRFAFVTNKPLPRYYFMSSAVLRRRHDTHRRSSDHRSRLARLVIANYDNAPAAYDVDGNLEHDLGHHLSSPEPAVSLVVVGAAKAHGASTKGGAGSGGVPTEDAASPGATSCDPGVSPAEPPVSSGPVSPTDVALSVISDAAAPLGTPKPRPLSATPRRVVPTACRVSCGADGHAADEPPWAVLAVPGQPIDLPRLQSELAPQAQHSSTAGVDGGSGGSHSHSGSISMGQPPPPPAKARRLVSAFAAGGPEAAAAAAAAATDDGGAAERALGAQPTTLGVAQSKAAPGAGMASYTSGSLQLQLPLPPLWLQRQPTVVVSTDLSRQASAAGLALNKVLPDASPAAACVSITATVPRPTRPWPTHAEGQQQADATTTLARAHSDSGSPSAAHHEPRSSRFSGTTFHSIFRAATGQRATAYAAAASATSAQLAQRNTQLNRRYSAAYHASSGDGGGGTVPSLDASKSLRGMARVASSFGSRLRTLTRAGTSPRQTSAMVHMDQAVPVRQG